MEHPPTIFNIAPEPPPFPDSPRTVDLSSLKFILALIAVIAIPALIYTFFFSIKWPPTPFRRSSSGSSYDQRSLPGSSNQSTTAADKEQLAVSSDVKYRKETHVKDIGSECPVCLSVFADGEEVKQLSGCKHSFHASCIDMWLTSHNNCPVCRASVPVIIKRPSNGKPSTSRDHHADLHQGLPDAASLV
ncbi:hypothetical protein Tsubulata_018699 [Turnera subulata]|uniref:RING-type domain-containing protein n=1 Tax=Turnera subulata TaxID=218843 RepID=A0A9Q0JGN9_9ROSI|nr:hypothetical protein Tsubulata_018699 [Turnera subulata]